MRKKITLQEVKPFIESADAMRSDMGIYIFSKLNTEIKAEASKGNTSLTTYVNYGHLGDVADVLREAGYVVGVGNDFEGINLTLDESSDIQTYHHNLVIRWD